MSSVYTCTSSVCVCACVRACARTCVSFDLFVLQVLLLLLAFVSVILLVGCQKEHLACKRLSVRCGCCCLSGVRCRSFAYGPADVTAIPKPHHLLPNLNHD